MFRLHGTILPDLLLPLGLLTLISAASSWLVLQEHIHALPLEPFTVAGIALGLMLGLRTNASYDRFWEGRKAWGAMVNRSRNIVRQSTVLVSQAEAKKMAEWVARFAHATREQLWGQGKIESGLPAPQRCLFELDRLVGDWRASETIDSLDRLGLEEDLAVLVDQLGVCERIQKTPFPPAYVLHLRQFLLVYCTALPLALVKNLGPLTPLAVCFLAYVFLGIERIGTELENPFEKTPHALQLEAICGTIERDVLATAESGKA